MKMPQSRRQSTVMITWAVLAALALAPSGSAQEDGTISGTVRDATGAVLPGVTVEVRGTAAGGAIQTAITDVTGMFTITALQSGTYNVALTLPGFSTFVRDGVKISAGATVALDVVMSVEGIQQHVVVVGSRAQPRSVTESPVPIDAIPFQDIVRQGGTSLPWCTTPIEADSSLGPDSHHPIISLSGIPSAVMVLRILHPIRASTLCAANPLARIAEPTIAL